MSVSRPVCDAVQRKLTALLRPTTLLVVNDSHKHAGHSGNPSGAADAETHLAVTVISNEFEGKSLVARHRLVYGALKEELEAGLHALALVTETPAEYAKRLPVAVNSVAFSPLRAPQPHSSRGVRATMRDAAVLSVNEREFVVRALQEEARVDGRRPLESRELRLQILRDGAAEVQLGDTRVLAVASGELAAPFPDRPSEGQFALSVEFSPMASPEFEPGRGTDAAVELSRFLERGLKQSGAVDMEALVVQPGRWVWTIRVDIHVLDHGGSAATAASAAAMAALLTHRRPEVTLNPATGALQKHATEVREALALSLHHVPLVTTFAFVACDGAHSEPLMVVDPTVLEEKTCDSTMLVMMNVHKDVGGIQKAGGVGVSPQHLLDCMQQAALSTQRTNAILRAAVKRHDQERLAGRVRRHKAAETADTAMPPAPQLPPPAHVDAVLHLGGPDGDEPADEQPADAAADWDTPGAAVGSFPFRGPLHPDRAAADMDDGDEDIGPGAARVPAPELDVAVPTSLLDAVKPKHRRVKR